MTAVWRRRETVDRVPEFLVVLDLPAVSLHVQAIIMFIGCVVHVDRVHVAYDAVLIDANAVELTVALGFK